MKQDSIGRIYLLVVGLATVVWGQILVVPLLTILATIVAGFLRPRWKINDHDWIVFVCGLFFSTLAVRWFVPHNVDELRWFLLPWLVLSIAEFLLLASALELFRYRDRSRLPTHFPAWGLGVLICNHHYVATRYQHYLFLLSALLCVSLAVVFFQRDRAERVPRHHRKARGQASIFAVVFLLVGMLSWQGYEVFANTENAAANWLYEKTRKPKKKKLPYEQTGRLDAITLQQQNQPEEIAFEVHAFDEPGYLRGKVYDTFGGNGWSRNAPNREERAMHQVRLDLPMPVQNAIHAARQGDPQQVFQVRPRRLKDDSESLEIAREMHIINDSERGRQYFAPLNTTFVSGISPTRSLVIDENGVMHGGMNEQEPYTIFFRDDVAEVLTPWERQRYALISRTTHSVLSTALSNRICAGATTNAEKIKAVENYCQSTFRLRAESAPPLIAEAQEKMKRRAALELTSSDLQDLNMATSQPLTYFLQKQPPATCEYFASTAAILLRDEGVPARYVTGYAVREGVGTQSWIARNRDAHAWVEAYDDDAKQWVTVEATPGMMRIEGHGRRRRNRDEQLAPVPKQEKKLQVARLERKSVYVRFQDWLGRLLGLPFILTMLGIGALAVLIARRMRNTLPEEQFWLTQVERKLRKFDLVRRNSETLHQFAHRVKEYPYGDQQSPPLREFATWLMRYAHHRYGRVHTLDAPPGVSK